MKRILIYSTFAMVIVALTFLLSNSSCSTNESAGKSGALDGSVAERAYVAPGEHDEFYGFFLRWIQWSGRCVWSSFRTSPARHSGLFCRCGKGVRFQ